MDHRHLVGDRATLAAIDDLLENGTLTDWRPALTRVLQDPRGELAQGIETLLDRRDYQESGAFWRAYLEHVRTVH